MVPPSSSAGFSASEASLPACLGQRMGLRNGFPGSEAGGCHGAGEDAVAPGRMLSQLGWFHHIWEDTWEDARAAGRMPARLLRELLQINTRNKKIPPLPTAFSHPCAPGPVPGLLPQPLPAASGIPLRQPAALQSPRGGQQKALQGLIPPAVTPPKAPRVTHASLAHAAEAQRVKSHQHRGPRPYATGSAPAA